LLRILNEEQQHTVIGFFFLFNDLSVTKSKLCGSDEFSAGSSLVDVRAILAGQRDI